MISIIISYLLNRLVPDHYGWGGQKTVLIALKEEEIMKYPIIGRCR